MQKEEEMPKPTSLKIKLNPANAGFSVFIKEFEYNLLDSLDNMKM